MKRPHLPWLHIGATMLPVFAFSPPNHHRVVRVKALDDDGKVFDVDDG